MTAPARHSPSGAGASLAPPRGLAPATADTETDRARAMRRRLSLAPLPRGLAAWLWPLAVTALAAVLRLWDLGRIRELVFDETYYVKDAYTMLRTGAEQQWPEEPDAAFEAGRVDTFLPEGDFVVHPPVGKWVIAAGEWVLGADSPWGWRIAVAVLGTLAVLLLARIATRMFRSVLLGTLAGLLLAVDGMAITLSRTALLDGILMVFVLAAFGALVLDRDFARGRAAVIAAFGTARPGARDVDGWAYGPRYVGSFRYWRVVAGLLLGLACGVKWSGLYVLAVFGLLTVAWDLAARVRLADPHPVRRAVLRDGLPAFVAMVGTALAAYVASWAGWFASDRGWGRAWAQENPAEGLAALVPPALRSLWHYHTEMYRFHVGLDSTHTYQADPLGWILQLRPTSFFYRSLVHGQAGCEVERCSAAVTSLGNPLIWWLGAGSLLVLAVVFVLTRDWRAGAIWAGVIAGWAPWFLYPDRTTFTFYAIVFAPFVVLALTYALGLLIGTRTAAPDHRFAGSLLAGSIVSTIVLASAFFYPIWTGEVIPYPLWRAHMWLPSWI